MTVRRSESMTALIDRFIEIVERCSSRVEVELEADPPVIVAYASNGLVCAAAWMSEEELIVRIRLDAQVPEARMLEHIDGGSLTYEASIRTFEQLDQLEATLRRAEQLATRPRSN